jgi:hypothetical protein
MQVVLRRSHRFMAQEIFRGDQVARLAPEPVTGLMAQLVQLDPLETGSLAAALEPAMDTCLVQWPASSPLRGDQVIVLSSPRFREPKREHLATAILTEHPDHEPSRSTR